MAVVNVNNLLNGKDSRWLQLEVCREFQRNKCTRPDTECKFAHPPTNVEVQNGRVTACYDSIKGRCNRDKPPCKYFHPPQHLKDQLLINGRNHLALKNALLQQMGLAPGQPMIPSQMPTVDVTGKLQFPGSSAATAAATALALGQPSLGFMTAPYLPGVPQVGNTFSPYFSAAPIMPTTAAILGPDPNNPLSMAVQQTVVTQQKMPRTDRLEPTTAAGLAALTAAAEIGRKRPLDATNDDFLMAFPGMMPYKRAAGDKSGIPVYQQSAAAAAAYQQLLQPFVPVSCEYRLPTSTSTAATSAYPSAATAAAFPNTGASIAAAAGAFPTSAANAAAAAAAAAAFTGIALNKQPSAAVTATAPTASLAASPRFQTLNPATAAALTQHFLPTLAAFRPQFSTVAPSMSFSTTTPSMSSHFSDFFAAAQLASLASGAGNLVAHSSAGNVLSSGASSLYAGSFNGTSSHNINNLNSNSNIINNNNNSSSNNNNNDDDLQPFKKMKTS